MELVVSAIATALIAGVLAFQIIQFRRSSDKSDDGAEQELREENAALNATLLNARERIEELDTQLDKERREREEKSEQLSAEQTKVLHLESKLSEQEENLQKQHEQLREQFENLSNRLLEEQSKKFSAQNREKLGELLTPFSERMADFRRRVDTLHSEDTKQRSALEAQIKSLQDANLRISNEAQSLTRALKGDNKAAGNWGERVLETVLEHSGLRNGYEYQTQTGYKHEDGKTRIPDVVVKLPSVEGERQIIIDSKLSLVAYERYTNSDSKDDKTKALKEHIGSLKTHINDVASKDYPQLEGINTVDFIIVFIPLESALELALQSDIALLTDANSKNVMLATPTSLLTALRSVSYSWQQNKQEKNVMLIAKEAGGLYDKFVGLYESIQGIGKSIRGSLNSYDEAITRIEGRGGIIPRIEKLKKLGAKASKTLPGRAMDTADEEEK